MNSQSLHDFMDGGGHVDLSHPTELIASTPESLTEDQLGILWVAISSQMKEDEVRFNSDFSLANEIEAQIKLVRLMRANIATPDGRQLLPGVDGRSLKDIITASTNLVSTLVKNQAQVLNFSRMQAIEKSVSEVVREFPADVQDKFFALLKKKLAAID